MPTRRPILVALVTACAGAVTTLALVSCRAEDAARTPEAPPAATAAQVRIVADEADAALAVLALLRAGTEPKEDDWRRLFESEGYRRLKRREEAMKRPFEDAPFAEFLRAEETLAGADALSAALDDWRGADTTAAARRALAYLPSGAIIRAALYPVIKPQTNSFVFETATDPAIFMYLDPNVSRAKLENTLAHELHHIGYASSCVDPPREGTPEGVATAMTWAGAFGEGLAMLAAAGSPDIHPHAASDLEERARWDRDVANVAADLPRVETFLLDVIEGRLEGDAVRAAGMEFFGVQGPWYTVGWSMAVTIEKVYGKERLIEVMCEPRRLLATYNAAAKQSAAAGGPRPLWSDKLMQHLGS